MADATMSNQEKLDEIKKINAYVDSIKKKYKLSAKTANSYFSSTLIKIFGKNNVTSGGKVTVQKNKVDKMSADPLKYQSAMNTLPNPKTLEDRAYESFARVAATKDEYKDATSQPLVSKLSYEQKVTYLSKDAAFRATITEKMLNAEIGAMLETDEKWEDIQKSFYELRNRTDSNAIKLRSNDKYNKVEQIYEHRAKGFTGKWTYTQMQKAMAAMNSFLVSNSKAISALPPDLSKMNSYDEF